MSLPGLQYHFRAGQDPCDTTRGHRSTVTFPSPLILGGWVKNIYFLIFINKLLCRNKMAKTKIREMRHLLYRSRLNILYLAPARKLFLRAFSQHQLPNSICPLCLLSPDGLFQYLQPPAHNYILIDSCVCYTNLC